MPILKAKMKEQVWPQKKTITFRKSSGYAASYVLRQQELMNVLWKLVSLNPAAHGTGRRDNSEKIV
jgi:hypothetical protein